jgi:rubrerythrin
MSAPRPDLAAIRVDGVTRGAFLARTALAAGALYGAAAAGPAVIEALAHNQHTGYSGGDLGIANFALTLERIEVAFYKQALAAPGLDAETTKLLQGIAKNEDDHSKQLTQTIQQLGGKPAPPPQVKLPDLSGRDAILRFAIELEDTGVSAYNGAATQIQSKDLLQAAASIAQIEGRHAGALRQLVGEDPTTGPFDEVFSGEDADAAVHRLTEG